MTNALAVLVAIVVVAYARQTRQSVEDLVMLIVQRANQWGQQVTFVVSGWFLFGALLAAGNANMKFRLIYLALPVLVLAVAFVFRATVIVTIVVAMQQDERGKSLLVAIGQAVGWTLGIAWIIHRMPIHNNPLVLLIVPVLITASWLINLGHENVWLPRVKRAIMIGIGFDIAGQLGSLYFPNLPVWLDKLPAWLLPLIVVLLALFTGKKQAASATATAKNATDNGSLMSTIVYVVFLAFLAFGVYAINTKMNEAPKKVDFKLGGLTNPAPTMMPTDRPICLGAEDQTLSGESQTVVASEPGCWSGEVSVTSFWGFESPTSCGKLWRRFGDGTIDEFGPTEVRPHNPRFGTMRFMTERSCAVTVTSYPAQPTTMSVAPPPTLPTISAPAVEPTPDPGAPPVSDAHDGGTADVPNNKKKQATEEMLTESI